jgi:hypothetical protein
MGEEKKNLNEVFKIPLCRNFVRNDENIQVYLDN